MRARKWLIWGGYGGFTFVAFLVSLYLTFPAEAVGQRLAHELQRQTHGKVSVSFRDVSLYRLSGIEAEGVVVRSAKAGQQPTEVKLDAARARLRLLPLLWLSLSFDTEVQLGDGFIDARITPRAGEDLDTKIEIEALNLATPPVLPALAAFPMRGAVEGMLEAAWRKDVKKASGASSLSWKGASIGPGTIEVALMPGSPTKTPFSLPGAELGDITLELKLEGERLTIASFKQKGGDLQLKLSGSMTLRPQVQASSLDLCFEMRAVPAFLEKNPKIKTALQLAEMQLRKDTQGFLNVPLGGTVQRPRLRRGLCRGS